MEQYVRVIPENESPLSAREWKFIEWNWWWATLPFLQDRSFGVVASNYNNGLEAHGSHTTSFELIARTLLPKLQLYSGELGFGESIYHMELNVGLPGYFLAPHDHRDKPISGYALAYPGYKYCEGGAFNVWPGFDASRPSQQIQPQSRSIVLASPEVVHSVDEVIAGYRPVVIMSFKQ